jgi:hypothetical protein
LKAGLAARNFVRFDNSVEALEGYVNSFNNFKKDPFGHGWRGKTISSKVSNHDFCEGFSLKMSFFSADPQRTVLDSLLYLFGSHAFALPALHSKVEFSYVLLIRLILSILLFVLLLL